MLELIATMGVLQVVLATVNVVTCIWDHDTKTLVPWMLSGLGWFVVVLQMLKRIIDGESR